MLCEGVEDVLIDEVHVRLLQKKTFKIFAL